MEAFPRRSFRAESKPHMQSAALPVLSPLQVQDLFAARLEEICTSFEAWHYPLLVGGKLGAAVPGDERDALQLSLTDAAFGTAISVDIRSVAFEASGAVAGDEVRVSGFLRARGQRGQAVLRFEAIAIERCDPARELAVQADKKILDVLRRLPTTRSAYPELEEFSMLVVYPESERDGALVHFRNALGGGLYADCSRFVGLDHEAPHRLLAAIETCRETVLVLIAGGRGFPAVWFDDALLLEALSRVNAYRVLALEDHHGHALAARIADQSVASAEDAARHIRAKNARLWHAQEEERAQMEEITALRESVEGLSLVKPALSAQARVGIACFIFMAGIIFALVVSSFR